jgi:O-acetylhomoserine (thiol)-lyase
MSSKPYRFETLALHAGQVPDATLSRGVPVYRTSSYLFKNTEHAANLFALKELGNIYTRLMNPTTDILEQRITQLEGGAASVALASGTSAIFYSIITLAQAGDEIVSANNLYGGTYTQFDAILPQFGITTRFVDPNDPKNFEKAITDKTRAIFIETIGNPVLDFTDVAAVAAVAHKHGLPLIVDATFTTPYLLRTIEHGADIVVNSLTKWLGGHGAGIGGIVTDSGKFNWKNNPRFPLLNNPDPNYHGLKWAHDLPAPLAPIAFALRVRTVPLRNLGAASRLTIRGSSSRAWRRCRCAWPATAKTRSRWPSSSRSIPRSRGFAIRDSKKIRPTPRPAAISRTDSAAWWYSGSRAATTPR